MAKSTCAAAAALSLVALTACGEATGPDVEGASVAVRFETRAPGPSVSLAGGGAAVLIEGTNGSLRIDDLHLVVAEFELDRLDDDACDALTEAAEDACEEFEAGPFLVQVPLNGGSTVVVSTDVPADTYRRFEFEVEDLDDDEEDPSEAARIQAVLAQIQADIPDWPKDASMLAVGEFLPAGGGDARPFRVFFEAEIEIERPFEPPMVVTGDEPQHAISVELDPALWFLQGDGTVRDLSLSNGTLVAFEVEIEQGFVSIEFD